MRYTKLLQSVREKDPKCIVEIGVWNGKRALQLLNLAPDAIYYGFDLFEDATRENDRVEFNNKPHYFHDSVLDLLTGFKAHLIKGNTRETLKTFKPELPIDFLWIDGGHSVETIRSDWENLKPHLAKDAMVFFDDYYTGPELDTTRIGCNEVIRELKYEVLDEADPIKGGGYTHIARVLEW